MFEALEDAGLEPAAINFTCYRGRTRHPIKLPALRPERTAGTRPSTGRPTSSTSTSSSPSAPARRSPSARGSKAPSTTTRRRWAAGSSRATHSTSSSSTSRTTTTPRTSPGPTGSLDALERTDGALGAAARGGRRARGVPRALRGRRHAPTTGRRRSSGWRELQDAFPAGARRTSSRSRRTAPGWCTGLPGCRVEARELAERLDESPAADVVLFLRGRRRGRAARRRRASLRAGGRGLAPGGRRRRARPRPLPERPRAGLARGARARPRATCSSPRPTGWELADGGGRHHAGGGSHGSLVAGDSYVPADRGGLRRAAVPAGSVDHRPGAARPRPLRRARAGVDAEDA